MGSIKKYPSAQHATSRSVLIAVTETHACLCPSPLSAFRFAGAGGLPDTSSFVLGRAVASVPSWTTGGTTLPPEVPAASAGGTMAEGTPLVCAGEEELLRLRSCRTWASFTSCVRARGYTGTGRWCRPWGEAGGVLTR